MKVLGVKWDYFGPLLEGFRAYFGIFCGFSAYLGGLGRGFGPFSAYLGVWSLDFAHFRPIWWVRGLDLPHFQLIWGVQSPDLANFRSIWGDRGLDLAHFWTILRWGSGAWICPNFGLFRGSRAWIWSIFGLFGGVLSLDLAHGLSGGPFLGLDWIWPIFGLFGGPEPGFGPFWAYMGVHDLDLVHFWPIWRVQCLDLGPSIWWLLI